MFFIWQSLRDGSETATVPVVTMGPATVKPPAPFVEGIMEKQQHQPEEKRRPTKTCLACGQPKSRYESNERAIIALLCFRNLTCQEVQRRWSGKGRLPLDGQVRRANFSFHGHSNWQC